MRGLDFRQTADSRCPDAADALDVLGLEGEAAVGHRLVGGCDGELNETVKVPGFFGGHVAGRVETFGEHKHWFLVVPHGSSAVSHEFTVEIVDRDSQPSP